MFIYVVIIIYYYTIIIISLLSTVESFNFLKWHFASNQACVRCRFIRLK